MEYDEFLLEVRHDGEIAAKLTTPQGEIKQEGKLGLSERERLYLHEDVDRLREGADLGERGLLRMGERLYDALFPGTIGSSFVQAMADARRRGSGVRVRISIDRDSDAADWPLEFLRCTAKNEFWLATEKELLTLSRVGEGDYQSEDHPITTIRVLVVASKPRRLGGVMTAKTLEKIGRWAIGESEAPSPDTMTRDRSATAGRMSRRQPGIEAKLLGVVEEFEREVPGIQYLGRPATFENIGEVAEAGEWRPHVLHFIGHGKLEDNCGHLALVKNGGDAAWYNAKELAELFNGWRPRLVVLQACESSLPPTGPGFLSLAAYMARQDIPDVVAMQYGIGNAYATEFVAGFYEALAKGLSIDIAVQKGRWKIAYSPELDVRWRERHFGTPVLFMLKPGGIIQPVSAITDPVWEQRLSAVTGPGEEPSAVGAPPLPPSSAEEAYARLMTLARKAADLGLPAKAAQLYGEAAEIRPHRGGKTFGSGVGHAKQAL